MPSAGAIVINKRQQARTTQVWCRLADGGAENVPVRTIMRLCIHQVTPHPVDATRALGFNVEFAVITRICRDMLKEGIDVIGIGLQEIIIGIHDREYFPDDRITRRPYGFPIPGSRQPFLWCVVGVIVAGILVLCSEGDQGMFLSIA